MNKLILLLLVLFLLVPSIFAQQSCSGRKICFNVEQQNCLFLNFIPYDVIVLLVYGGFYLMFKQKIKKISSRNKIIMGISAVLLFFILALILGKTIIFQMCGA